MILVHYFLYISRDADIYCLSIIIPLQINVTENISFPIFRHRFIVCIQCVEEVLCVLLPFTFHSKVIYHKSELDLFFLFRHNPGVFVMGMKPYVASLFCRSLFYRIPA